MLQQLNTLAKSCLVLIQDIEPNLKLNYKNQP
jgi:hypothetical protein